MPHDFSDEIKAAFAAYAPRRKGTLALPPPRFNGGPYFPPHVSVGDEIECARFGPVRVIGWSRAPLPWPQCRGQRRGRASMILCADLVRAIELESATAVALAWGVSSFSVSKWRKILEVESINAGTSARLKALMPYNITEEQNLKGRAVVASIPVRVRAATMEERRAARGLSLKRQWTPAEIAQMGVSSDETIAEHAGCHVRTVGAERQRRGIASIQCGGTDAGLLQIDGARVQARRWELNLTQNQVGALFGCDRCRISHLENGRKPVNQETLDKLARALRCSPETLLARDP